jgi:hypothetical protein
MAGIAATNITNVNISDTFYGLLHAGGQNIPPTGQSQIYDGYGTPTALKLGANCNGATICGPLSATSVSFAQKLSASTDFDIYNLLSVIQPVGSVLFTFNNDNPGTRTGWGSTTWIQISQGRFVVGVGTGFDSVGTSRTFNLSGNTGEYNHILTVAEMPAHNHVQAYSGGDRCDNYDCVPFTAGGTNLYPQAAKVSGAVYRDGSTMKNTGGSQAHNNTPPGFGLYVWQRTV